MLRQEPLSKERDHLSLLQGNGEVLLDRWELGWECQGPPWEGWRPSASLRPPAHRKLTLTANLAQVGLRGGRRVRLRAGLERGAGMELLGKEPRRGRAGPSHLFSHVWLSKQETLSLCSFALL